MHTAERDTEIMLPKECWFAAPAQLTRRFSPVFREVSRALHQTLREAVPSLLFRDPSQLADTKYAYAILVYSASRPSGCREHTEFCYDVLDQENMTTFFRSARRKLTRKIADARSSVIAAGMDEFVDAYDPADAEKMLRWVRMHRCYRQPLNQMLVTEGRLMDELIQLSMYGRCNAKDRAKHVGTFNKKWNIALRKFCGGFDFTELGPQLLKKATEALIRAQAECDATRMNDRSPFDLAA